MPIGIDFKKADGLDQLPFDDVSFNIIINKHGDFNAKDIYRLLKKLGVHAWADGDGNEATKFPKDDPTHDLYISYYEEMKLPDPKSFYFFTINAADAKGMHNMTKEDLHNTE